MFQQHSFLTPQIGRHHFYKYILKMKENSPLYLAPLWQLCHQLLGWTHKTCNYHRPATPLIIFRSEVVMIVLVATEPSFQCIEFILCAIHCIKTYFYEMWKFTVSKNDTVILIFLNVEIYCIKKWYSNPNFFEMWNFTVSKNDTVILIFFWNIFIYFLFIFTCM